MFFEIAKTFGVLLDPANVLLLLLVLVAWLLWRRRWRAARRLVTVAVIALATLIFTPLTSLLLLPLEQRFPMPTPFPDKVDGIIMLGGAQQPALTAAYGQPALNARAERMNSFLALARRYPAAKLVASGGSGNVMRQELSEAETTRLFLIEQGFDPARVVFESKSRNTYENAVLSKEIVSPQPAETWLLVTSAADIPRAVGVFRKLGWPVVPVPCDYNATPPNWKPSLSLLMELDLLHYAVHEWAGLAAYYLTGKSESLFPAPSPPPLSHRGRGESGMALPSFRP
jgi:uncharacterized SAM-binding protein YcdF (DUF218 family)